MIEIIHNSLKKIGLDKKEVAVFLILLEEGKLRVRDIAKAARINRTTAYGILKELINKGLVSSTQEKGVLMCQSIEPGLLINYIERLEANLAEQKKEIKDVLPQIKSLRKKKDIYPRIQFFEGIEGREGKPIVEEYLKHGVFEKSEGAIVYRGDKHGLHTRVFINSQGLPTYEAKELGLNRKKFELEPNLEKSIIVTANEQSEYFKVVLRAMGEIFPEIAKRTKHLAHGMLRLSTGKMSSRTGNVITGESLMTAVEAMVHKKLEERELETVEKNKIAEAVAICAIKYSILKQAIGSDIIYDFEKSISFEGDSGPYLQYSYVRAKSVLQKAKDVGIEPVNLRKAKPSEISLLERLLVRFPEVVLRAGSEYAPHLVATYLTELAGSFNSYYAKNQIVNVEDSTSAYKAALTESFAATVKNGLWLLGIQVPERM